MDQITRSAVELRLDASNWPTGLEDSTSSGPMRLREALDAAKDTF